MNKDNHIRYDNVDMVKREVHKASTYTKNYKQLRDAERVFLREGKTN